MIKKFTFVAIYCFIFQIQILSDQSHIQTNSSFWDLDMSSPKVSSEAFIDLMKNDNYAEAFFYLHYRTQNLVSRAAMLSDFVFFGESENWAKFILAVHSEQEVQLNSAIYAFDQAMGYLRKNGGHYLNWWDDWQFHSVSTTNNNKASCLFIIPNENRKLCVIVKMTEANRWKVVYGKDISNANVKYWPKFSGSGIIYENAEGGIGGSPEE